MLTWLQKYRIEIKHSVITLAILGGMGWLGSVGVFDGVEKQVNNFMETLTDYGYVGLFFIGLVSNVTLVFLIPYALPLFTLSIYADSILEVVALGTAAGVGAGIGEVTSYAVAHTIVANVDDLEKSALFRWTRRTIEQHPRVIPVFVWLASATPAPDLVIIVPLAMIQYSWKKMIVPMITGKIFQNVVMALVYRYAADAAESLVSRDINFDMTASITIIFVMFIVYQIEKTNVMQTRRQNKRDPHATQETEQVRSS